VEFRLAAVVAALFLYNLLFKSIPYNIIRFWCPSCLYVCSVWVCAAGICSCSGMMRLKRYYYIFFIFSLWGYQCTTYLYGVHTALVVVTWFCWNARCNMHRALGLATRYLCISFQHNSKNLPA